MKKVILTEKQVESLMAKVVNEQVPAVRENDYEISDGKFHVKCTFSIDHDEYTPYNNGEIDMFGDGVGIISYMLDIDARPYGIQNIKVTNIEYPPTIKTTIRYYPEGVSSEDEDWYEKRQEDQIDLPIDWSKTETYSWDDDKQIKYIGVGNRVRVDVKPDGKGGIIGYVDEIDIREVIGNRDE